MILDNGMTYDEYCKMWATKLNSLDLFLYSFSLVESYICSCLDTCGIETKIKRHLVGDGYAKDVLSFKLVGLEHEFKFFPDRMYVELWLPYGIVWSADIISYATLYKDPSELYGVSLLPIEIERFLKLKLFSEY
jgi:hypothetical protein